MHSTFCFLLLHCIVSYSYSFSYNALGLLLQSCLRWKLRNRANRVGDTVAQGSVPQPSCSLSCYVMIKGIENRLAIGSFLKPFKRILETLSPISSLRT